MISGVVIGSEWLTARLVALAVAAGADVRLAAGEPPLRHLVEAVHGASAALERLGGEPYPPWRLAVAVAGGRLLGVTNTVRPCPLCARGG